MLSRHLLVIVTGLPGTGKTTLRRWLVPDLGLPCIHKDGIKEALFDSLGWSDGSGRARLGLASYDLLYYFLDVELAAGRSVVVESNFSAQYDTPRFLALKEWHEFLSVQVLCHAAGTVVLERFRARAASPDRHSGHVEDTNMAEFEAALLRGRIEPLDIGGATVEVETSDFERIDYDSLALAMMALLESGRAR